ncbi:MAG: DUF1343 domain-containing protein [Rikenellaceae bacterium]
MKKILYLILLLSCGIAQGQVLSGIDVLQSNGFEQLRGKRIGLITNPTGVNSSLRSTIDILSSPEALSAGVELVALFAPEHGVRGDIEAGKVVSDVRDTQTGAMVYSLYGNGMKPKAAQLKGLDALVFDIADIGSRSYTFISTLGLAIEAAGEAGLEFVVLDRPNPLGGNKVEGGGVMSGYSSFVSKYNVAYIHGLTVGELARLYVGEGFLKANPTQLTVVPMVGWSRWTKWEDTQLSWVPSSPHIPHSSTSVYYPVTGMIGELQTINIGVGYTMPFELFGAEWIEDAEVLAQRLNNKKIEGVVFRPIHYVPYYGSSKGKRVHGVQVHITELESAPLTLIGLYVMEEVIGMYPIKNPFTSATAQRIEMYDKVLGSSELRERFAAAGYMLTDEIVEWWCAQSSEFKEVRRKYFIY